MRFSLTNSCGASVKLMRWIVLVSPEERRKLSVRVTPVSTTRSPGLRKRLKPGDRVVLTGVTRTDSFLLSSGETRTIHRISLTLAPQLFVKEKRISTTVFEQNRH